MGINLTGKSWPNKTIPNFTDAELAAAIEEHQDDPDPVTRQIVQGCWREWERRHGLTSYGEGG